MEKNNKKKHGLKKFIKPKPDADPEDVKIMKQNLGDRILPASLIPLATANAMITTGSHKLVGPGLDCYFDLPRYLVTAGSVSLALVVIAGVGAFVQALMLKKKYFSLGERRLLKCLDSLGLALLASEFTMLMVGAVFIFPKVSVMQYDSPYSPNYCHYGMAMFSVIFLGLALGFMAIGILCVWCLACAGDPRDDAEDVEAFAYEPDASSSEETTEL